MHSKDINDQFETSFHRIDTTYTSGVKDANILALKEKVRQFISDCESGNVPALIMQHKLRQISSEIREFDALSNHGYLYLVFEEMKNKQRSLPIRVIQNTSENQLSNLLGKTKLREDALNEVALDRQIGKHNRFSHSSAYELGIEKIKKSGWGDRVGSDHFNIGKIGDLNITMFNGKESNSHGTIFSHDNKGTIHHILNVETPAGYAENTIVTKLASNNPNINSPIKMHHIYHHLIKSGMTLMSDRTQSEGGLGVWKKLARIPGVNVHGWDIKKNEPVNSDRFLRSTEDTHRDLHDVLAGDDHGLSVHNDVRLIAHKKGLNEETLNEITMIHNQPKSNKLEDSMYYGNTKFHEMRDYLGGTHKESSLGKINSTNLTQFEETNPRKTRGTILSHDDSGNIHHVLHYDKPYRNSPHTIKIKSITGNDNVKKDIGAHDIYKNLLDSGHVIESDNSQTKGGLKIWQHLASTPGINVHGWDTENSKKVDVDSYLSQTEKNPHSEEHHADNVVLVAHKN